MDEFTKRLALALANGAISPGDVALATVEHDDDCKYFHGGTCDCDPIIMIAHPQGRILIDANGEARLVYAN